MTDKEWAALQDPDRRLNYLEERGCCDQRKARLFGVACCRRVWRVFTDDRSRTAIDMAEHLADGEITRREMDRIVEMAREAINGHTNLDRPAETVARSLGMKKIRPAYVAWLCRYAVAPHTNYHDQHRDEAGEQLDLVRDIFGSPFRPLAFDPAWRTSTAVALAKGMYESRDFGAMPILADALQDAGCDNEDVLNHCRSANQVHVRGCWVVDLVLGKV